MGSQGGSAIRNCLPCPALLGMRGLPETLQPIFTAWRASLTILASHFTFAPAFSSGSAGVTLSIFPDPWPLLPCPPPAPDGQPSVLG